MERFGEAGTPSGKDGAAGKDGALQRQKPNKSMIRCKHWPKCNNDPCEFHHPSEPCKFFPKCTYGDKCLYVHPDIPCKFADSCTRMNCSYKHSEAQTRNR